MAKGYPDFFGYPQFPSIGPVVVDYFVSAAVVSGVVTTIHSITTKGQILGGFCRPLGDYTGWPFELTLSIDGETAISFQPSDLYGGRVYDSKIAPIYLIDYADGGVNFTFGFSPGITFVNSYLFTLEHNEGANRTVQSWLYYTLLK